MLNHRQANLFISTHKMIDEIAGVMQKSGNHKGKVSKADVVHDAVSKLHKRMVKDGSTK